MKLVNIKGRMYPVTNTVEEYSPLLDSLYLDGFEYIPYLDALYNANDDIIIYSLDKLYQINDVKYFEYYQNIQLKYSQIQNLSTINYPGIYGFNVPVPMEYLGEDKTFNMEQYIISKRMSIITELSKDVTQYSYLLNEVVEEDWKISHTCFTQKLEPVNLGLVQSDVDFLQFAKIGLDGNMKVVYTHVSPDEVKMMSSKGLKVNVQPLELKAVAELFTRDLPDTEIFTMDFDTLKVKHPNLARSPLKINSDVCKYPKEGPVVLDFADLHLYSMSNLQLVDGVVAHDFERFRENVLPLLRNCQIIITNKRKMTMGSRFIALIK